MKILAIETSCDDTGIAILEVSGYPLGLGGFNVLSNIVSSQIEVHKKYGGVYPAMAKREHQKNLVPTLKSALIEAGMLGNPKSQSASWRTNPKFTRSNFAKQKLWRARIQNSKSKILNDILAREPELLKKIIPFLQKYEKPDINLISVTQGPGLEPCLWVGVNFAKALSYFWNIPIVPVNHIESHILVNFMEHKTWNIKQIFPAVCLVVSGGHTQLILMRGIGKYKILGETRDDAAGECFDKCAKILGLGYPGGPIISRLASESRGGRASTKLPRPMISTKDYDFSFSGLKTAVLYHHQKQPENIRKSKKYIAEMAMEIQQAVIDVLLKKTIKAAKDYKAKSIILGGGVSANCELRSQFKSKIQNLKSEINFLIPPANLSTDNGLMTAIAGYYNKNKKTAWQKLQAEANLRV